MSTIIKDGRGTGASAKVQSDGRMHVISEQEPFQAHASLAHSSAFQAHSGEQTVSPAGAYGVLALQNSSNTDSIMITYIRCGINDAETGEAKVEVNYMGTWVAGTVVTPTNMKAGDPKVFGVTAHYNAVPTSSTLVDIFYLSGPGEAKWTKEGSMIIPPGGIISLKVTTETDNVKVYGRISYIVLTQEQVGDRG